MILKALNELNNAIEDNPDTKNWVVAFSGGKDSSLVLKIIWNIFLRHGPHDRTLIAIYCDTGSENPLAAALATRFLTDLTAESHLRGVNFQSHILRPEIERRLIVRIAGRGYPPPNTFFRWCTKDLRIRPVQKFLSNLDQNSIICLGVRSGESRQRDRSFDFNTEIKYWHEQKEGKSSHKIFLPIVEFKIEDVWDALHWIDAPRSIDAKSLWDLYSEASGECPVIHSPQTPPCGSGRFGCWLCTVVKKDKSATHLAQAGHKNLLPLLDFREWLLSVRNLPSYRNSVRRSGATAMGPFRLSARREIYQRIRIAESNSGLELITPEEANAIYGEWRRDENCPKYRED